MLTLGILVLLAAEAPPAAVPAAPLMLVMPDLQAVNIDPKEAAFHGEHLAQQMKFPGVNVLTSREISAMLGLERQKQLLGCNDESTSCMAELASAMGADAVVLADVAHIGDAMQVNLKIVSAAKGTTLGTFSERASGESAVLDLLTRGAHELLLKTLRTLGRPVPDELLAARQSGLTRRWWLPGLAGVALVGGGVALFLVAQGDYRTLKDATPDNPLTAEQTSTALNRGRVAQPVGLGCIIAGGVALAASATLLAVGRAEAAQDVGVVGFAPLPGGGVAVYQGTFP